MITRMMLLGALTLSLAVCSANLQDQLTSPRVAQARKNKLTHVQALFTKAGVPYPAPELYLRAFKASDELEVWAGKKNEPLTLVTTYKVCARSGEVGPKRAMGDMQVPEGFYRVDRLNPLSNFHLSLGIDYPNASDRILGKAGSLGGDIFIHGSCVTIGCLPIEDDGIEELYLMVLDAKIAGLRDVTVHIFPGRLDDAGLAALFASQPTEALMTFWKTLAPAYTQFATTRRIPKVEIDRKTGAYLVKK